MNRRHNIADVGIEEVLECENCLREPEKRILDLYAEIDTLR